MIIKQNRGRQWLDWRRRMVTVVHYIGVAACLLLLAVLVFGDMGLPRYFSMREHAQQLDMDLQELQRTTRTLRGDIDRLEHDPAKIEQLAREQLGYVRKGETVYQLVPPPSQERPRP
ncbi:MAG: septum formation initiator family protein [Nitrospiraceae bacterium]|nr:septum formation initiator family protein [Nitrospiraceae bacterium]